MELKGQRAHPDKDFTGDEVDQKAKWCQDMLSKVLHTKVKISRICAKSKRWWTGELHKRGSTIWSEVRMERRSEVAAYWTAELQRSIRQSKIHM
jgi:hypothetical protein